MPALASSIRCDSAADCTGVDVGPCRIFGSSKRCNLLLSKTCSTDAECAAIDGGDCLLGNPSCGRVTETFEDTIFDDVL